MLASPISPSISLRSNSSGSSSAHTNTGGNNLSYSSPRHPAYLAHQSPSSHSITSTVSSKASSNNTSKYTTHSQIDRVNDVLVDKVLLLHQPRAVDHNQSGPGSALKRLIAFLDGDEEPLGVQDQLNAPIVPSALPIHSADAHNRHHAQESDLSHYPSSKDASTSAHPLTPPSTRLARSNLNANQHNNNERGRINNTHTPRASSSSSTSRDHTGESSRFHVSNGRDGYQAAPLQAQNERPYEHHAQRRTQEQSRAPAAHYQSHQQHNSDTNARHTIHHQINSSSGIAASPSQSILLSTQNQLNRLKSEVSHLDELVNRLKGQHFTHAPISGGGSSSYGNHGEPIHVSRHEGQNIRETLPDQYPAQDQHREANEEEQQRIAEQEAEAESRRQALEYESTPASHSDLLSLIRTLDSLVWLRTSSSSNSSSHIPSASGTAGRAEEAQEGNYAKEARYGRGDRSDNVIFTKGNLDHLTRRVKAWEHIVRSKEDEGRYSFIP